MRAYLNAKAEAEAFDATYDRIRAKWLATKPSPDTIHWREFFPERHTERGRDDIMRTMDIEERWKLFQEGEGKWWFPGGAPDSRQKILARHRAALDSVQTYRDAVKRHNRDSGMDAANDRTDLLSARYDKADTALMNTPAPDLAALRWKIERFRDNDGDLDSWTDKFVRQTFADLARLVPEAG